MTPHDEAEQRYHGLLARPDEELRFDAAAFEISLTTPGQALFRAALEELRAEPLPGKRIIDYGCGTAEFGLWLAAQSAEVYLVDESPAAIELGLKRARASGLTRRVRSALVQPAGLDMFADAGFDLVFARLGFAGPLAAPGVLEEVARILRPGGRLVVCQRAPEGGPPASALAAHQARMHALFRSSTARPINSPAGGWLCRFRTPAAEHTFINTPLPLRHWRGAVLLTGRR